MDEHVSDFPLRDYLRILVRRRWIVIVALVAALGVTTALSVLSPKAYAANSQILVTDPGEGSVFNPNLVAGIVAGRTLATQMQVLRSKPIEREVNRQLGERSARVRRVTVFAIGDTDVVAIRVESSVPAVARDAADIYARVYIDRRLKQAVATLIAAGNELLSKANEKKATIEALDAQIVKLSTQPKPDSVQIEGLRAQRNDMENQYATYRDRFDQVQVDASLRNGGAQMVATADLPSVPVRPTPIRNGVLGGILGLMLGIGLAFLFDFLDDTLRSSDDLERYAPDLAFLGAIPVVSDWRNRGRARAITLEDPQSVVSEAYRSLRTSVQFVALRQPLQTLLLSSPMSSEGKTTTVANLAVTMARSGRDVVVVDCDLRRPRVHEFFGISNAVGFTSVLLGDAPASAALHEVEVGAGGSLRVLPSGPLPPNPSELLGTNRVAEVLTALQATADMVLIDSPPLLPVTDALVVSRRVDGVLLVATAALTSRRHLRRSVDLLRQADTPLVGVILNGVSTETGYGGYEYGYGYRASDDRARRSRRRAGASRAPSAGR